MNSVLSISRHWWWLLLCALLGAGLVNTAFLFMPTRYVNQAQFIVTFNHQTSLDWTDETMPELSNSIADTFYDPTTIKRVLVEAKNQGIFWTEHQFQQRTNIDQRFFDWILTVDSSSARETQTMITIWSNTVSDIIKTETAAIHQAAQWKEKTTLLVSCFQQFPVEPVNPTCRYGNEEQLHLALIQALQQTQGIQAGLQYLPRTASGFQIQMIPPLAQSEAQPPASTGTGIILGAFAGFIAGVLTHNKDFPDIIFVKKRINPS